MQAVLQVVDERRAVDGALIIERQAEVLGERALARTIEARDPNTHFVFATGFHRELHAIEELAELLLDALGDHVLGDLGLEATFLRGAIGDDLLDGPVNVLAWIEE